MSLEHPMTADTAPPRFLRPLLTAEAVAFLLASMVHRGWLLPGYAHGAAATAESVIAAIVLAGLVLGLILPHRARLFGGVAQAFALLGTLVGVFAVIQGFGPQTGLDLAYHVVMVAVLVAGLAVSLRARSLT
jgi:hypothetical protein